MNAYFLFISGGEIAFILFVVVMIFGADKIPEIARGLGKGMTQLKNATNEIKSEITKSADGHGLDLDLVKDIKKDLYKAVDGTDTRFVRDVKSQIDSVKKDLGTLDDITGPIKRQL